MRITVYTVGGKMPSWVAEASAEYEKRLKAFATVKVVELPMAKRGKTGHSEQWREQEAELLLSKIPESSYKIVLDEKGKQYSTAKLASKLENLGHNHHELALIIGGPDGTSAAFKQQCNEMLGLSEFTFPHPMVRVILIEQLYRCFTLLAGHPYHRE